MTISTTLRLDADLRELSSLQDMAQHMGHPAADKAFLASRGAPTPKVWDDEAIRTAATNYYVSGPATYQCPYLLERAWLQATAGQVPGLELRFPHVEKVVRS